MKGSKLLYGESYIHSCNFGIMFRFTNEAWNKRTISYVISYFLFSKEAMISFSFFSNKWSNKYWKWIKLIERKLMVFTVSSKLGWIEEKTINSLVSPLLKLTQNTIFKTNWVSEILTRPFYHRYFFIEVEWCYFWKMKMFNCCIGFIAVWNFENLNLKTPLMSIGVCIVTWI